MCVRKHCKRKDILAGELARLCTSLVRQVNQKTLRTVANVFIKATHKYVATTSWKSLGDDSLPKPSMNKVMDLNIRIIQHLDSITPSNDANLWQQ